MEGFPQGPILHRTPPTDPPVPRASRGGAEIRGSNRLGFARVLMPLADAWFTRHLCPTDVLAVRGANDLPDGARLAPRTFVARPCAPARACLGNAPGQGPRFFRFEIAVAGVLNPARDVTQDPFFREIRARGMELVRRC